MFTTLTKVVSILMICLFIASGCGRSTLIDSQTSLPNSGIKNKVTIVTSFYPVYIATINITKGIAGVEVINLTKPQTGCLHDYQLTPEDMKTLEKANIFVVNGAGMEAYLQKAVQRYPQLKIIDASKNIALIKDDHGEENPHVWVSISNAILQVENIAAQLSLLDPVNAADYQVNAADYIERLTGLRNKMHRALENVSQRNIITFHEAFPYFAQEFNLHITAVIEREPGTELSPQEMNNICEKIKESKAPALFVEPQYPAKAAETIAKETGAKIYMLDPGVTGQAKPEAYDAYINLMEQNLQILQEALK